MKLLNDRNVLFNIVILIQYTFAALIPNDTTEVAFTSQQNGDLDLVVYKSENRSSLDPFKIENAIRQSSKFIIHFRDTNTILIANDDVGESVIEFHEYRYDDLQKLKLKLEVQMVPVSNCLSFNDADSNGEVSILYSSKFINKLFGNIYGEGKALFMGLSYSTTYHLIYNFKFSGSHTCSTSKGNSVRLFFQAFTTEINPEVKRLYYDRKKHTITQFENWEKIGASRYFVNVAPMYICGTSDKMDLTCGVSADEVDQ